MELICYDAELETLEIIFIFIYFPLAMLLLLIVVPYRLKEIKSHLQALLSFEKLNELEKQFFFFFFNK